MNYFIDLDIPPEWPVENSGTHVPYPPTPSTVGDPTLRASAISPNGKWIVGTYHNYGPPDISHYFVFQLDAASPLQYTALPLSSNANVTGRGVNDHGDVAGWIVASGIAAFFREAGKTLLPIKFPVNAAGPADAPSQAYGVNNGPYVVGSYPNKQANDALIAFGAPYSASGVQQGNVDQLNKEIGSAVVDQNTNAPVVGDYVIMGINSRQDLLATVTPTHDVTISSILVPAQTPIQLVGLMRTFMLGGKGGPTFKLGRHWYVLRHPGDAKTLLGGVTLLGINSSRQIVGVSNTDGYYTEISDQGFLSKPVVVAHPKAKINTILTGISDDGVMVGAYDGLHPFVTFFVRNVPTDKPEPIYYMIPRPDPVSAPLRTAAPEARG
jgi:hypothetical protein